MTKKKRRKKKRKKGFKERLRERQLKHQRAIESHRIIMERKIQQRTKRAFRRKLLLATLSFAIILLGVYAIANYSVPSTPPSTPEKPESSEQPQGQQPSAEASEANAILIMPDGSILPSEAPISIIGDGYYLVEEDLTLPITVGKDNIVIDGGGHAIKGSKIFGSRGIDLAYRTNVTVKNFIVEGFDFGVYLNSTFNCLISKNDFMDNYCAIWISHSSDNQILSNNIANISISQGYGVWVKNSTGNIIKGNNISLYTYGIYVGYSSENTLAENLIENNRVGIFLYASNSNLLSGNRLSKNGEISLFLSSNNTVTLNTLLLNDVGLSLENSNSNIIYNNNFLNNSMQVYSRNSTNQWDGGVLKGGNYWSDYDGTDDNRDGIGDSPYVIDEANKDRYPLISEKSS